MKQLNNFILILVSLFALLSCRQKHEELSDLEKLRNNTNAKSYPAAKMDSAQAIQFITRQKIQELLDLSTLYAAGNKNTEIDSVIYAQMNGYFEKPDSTSVGPLLLELDSLKVKTAKVLNLNVQKTVQEKDTLDLASFEVEYLDDRRRSLGTYNRNAQYSLKMSPQTFKKEFKFYFVNFYKPLPKDSTASGNTR